MIIWLIWNVHCYHYPRHSPRPIPGPRNWPSPAKSVQVQDKTLSTLMGIFFTFRYRLTMKTTTYSHQTAPHISYIYTHTHTKFPNKITYITETNNIPETNSRNSPSTRCHLRHRRRRLRFTCRRCVEFCPFGELVLLILFFTGIEIILLCNLVYVLCNLVYVYFIKRMGTWQWFGLLTPLLYYCLHSFVNSDGCHT